MLTPWKKSYDQHRQRIKKQRHFPTKVHLVKAMVFPEVMYRFESWTIKKVECQRIDAFELWCWRRLLGVPWTARRSNQSVLKEINPECSLELLNLKLQYFSHLMWRADSLEKPSMLGKLESRRRGHQRMRWLYGTTDSMDISLRKLMGDSEGQERLACCSPWGHKELDTTEWLDINNNVSMTSSTLTLRFGCSTTPYHPAPSLSFFHSLFPEVRD